MTTMTSELYTALKKAGVDDETARAAASIVLTIHDREHLATKADVLAVKTELQIAIAELKADLTWRILLMTGVFVGAVGALKVFG